MSERNNKLKYEKQLKDRFSVQKQLHTFLHRIYKIEVLNNMKKQIVQQKKKN